MKNAGLSIAGRIFALIKRFLQYSVVASGLWLEIQGFPTNLSGHSPDATSGAAFGVFGE